MKDTHREPVLMRRFMTQLAQPALSYLMDHIVAGRCLLPGAAMFEATAAAGSTLPDASGLDLCLAGISIPTPVVMRAAKLQTLTCLVDLPQGAVHLQESSLAGPGMFVSVKCCSVLCTLSLILMLQSTKKQGIIHCVGVCRT